MDELDKKLYHDLSLEVEIPNKCKSVIKESLNDNKINRKKKHYSLAKIVVATCASFVLTAGIVYAGTAIVNKIWKQPEKVVGFYSDENTNQITEEEKASVMSEQEAIEKAKELLKKFGHEGEKIKLIQLDNNPNNYELEWYIQTDSDETNPNIISFDARGEDCFDVLFQDALNESIHNYRTTEEEAVKTARELCKKYGYDTEKYTKIDIRSNLEPEEAYIWYVDFYKEYDGIINPYESIKIGFVPEINDIYYLYVNNLKYENNPVEITEEQAKRVVLEAEQKTDTDYEMININTSLAINKMNGDAYKRITDYEQYYDTDNPSEKEVYYKTEGRVRKTWNVILEYDVPRFGEKEYKKSDFFKRYYTYYVDATTGEIIGGRVWK